MTRWIARGLAAAALLTATTTGAAAVPSPSTVTLTVLVQDKDGAPICPAHVNVYPAHLSLSALATLPPDGQADTDASGLIEYRPTADTRQIQAKVYVQYRARSPVVERIEVMLVQPFLRSSVLEALLLPADARPSLTRVNRRGVLEEYYGAPLFVVLTFAGRDRNSGVTRSARYSRDLFARVMTEIERGTE